MNKLKSNEKKKIFTQEELNDGELEKEVDRHARGYFLDTKVLGWLIIAYLAMGLYNIVVH